MTDKNILDNFEDGKPYLNHKNAILSAPVRHIFMIASIWYLTIKNKNKNISILEIGTWFGASALSWAQGLEEYADSKGSLTCVDAWKPFFDLEEHKGNEYVLEMEELLKSDFAYKVFLHNIGTVPESITTQHFRGQSENILKYLKDESQSVVFIDADHTYDFVKKDITASLRLVENNGIICGDDLNMQIKDIDYNFAIENKNKDFIRDPKTNKNYHPGVTVAISEIFGEVSSWGGFWAMQKINNNWNKISLKDMPIIYPKHFDKENIKKAKDHFNDIKNYLT
jgi:predicted O-methyltransferase YrrM